MDGSDKCARREAEATHTTSQRSSKNNRVTTRVMSGGCAQLEGCPQGLQFHPPTPQGYLSYIKSLPLNDMPEIFGLHDNANITFAQNETYALLGAIIQLQPKSSSVGGQGREEVGGSTGKWPKSWAGPISYSSSCLHPCEKELCSCEILQGLGGQP